MEPNPHRAARGISRSVLITIFAAPLVAALFVVALSPNYREQAPDKIRSGPIGADFLQEWVGANIVAAGQGEKLYDPEFSRQWQHDSARLGFEWNAHEYYPIVYPPFYYWLLSPLANVSLKTAAGFWCLLNALAFSLGLWMLARRLLPEGRIGAAWFVASVLYFPLLLSLNMGQKSGFLFLLIVGGFLLLQAGRQFSAGIVLGLLVFKPHLALLMFAGLLGARLWRPIVGAAIPISIACVISAAMGWEACVGFWTVCTGAANYSAIPGYSLANSHSAWTVAELALRDWSHAAQSIFTAGYVLVLAAAVAITQWRVTDVTSPRFRVHFSAIVVGLILLSPHLYTYDLSILLVPMLLVGGLSTATASFASGDSESSPSSASRIHLAFIACLYLGGGLLPKIADGLNFPASTFLLSAWLVLLMRDSLRDTNAPRVGAETVRSQGMRLAAGSR